MPLFPTPARDGCGEEALLSEEAQDFCLACDADLSRSDIYKTLGVCPNCGFHYTLTAWERIALLADADTFRERNKHLRAADPISFTGRRTYRDTLARVRKQTGLTEAVITGACRIEGIDTAILALDFGFLGGSMGIAVGEKVALIFEHARKRRLPLVAVVTSGGARMQEGILSLMQMAKCVTAARQFHEVGLPFIVLMASPTTGQVYASFANLADIALAEPNALIGFASLRTARQASAQQASPEPGTDAHTAETHLAHGTLDRIVPRSQQKQTIASLLKLLGSRSRLALRGDSERPVYHGPHTGIQGQTLEIARHQERPTAIDYLNAVFTGHEEVHGDRSTGNDESIITTFCYLASEPVAVIATDRSRMVRPQGIRKAQRFMRLAAKFHLPLITLIDTPGIDPSLQAEEEGVGTAIAHTLSLLLALPTPVVSAIVGEGGSEAALCLGLADRVLMQERAIYSPISPESAAAILYRDPSRAEDVVTALRVTAKDCAQLKIIDEVVQEPADGAHTNPAEAIHLLQDALIRNLIAVQSTSVKKLVRERQDKFRAMGNQGSFLKTGLGLGAQLGRGVQGLRSRLPRRSRFAFFPESPMPHPRRSASPEDSSQR